MAETIKIGGELESTATGNVVAAANAIEDKAKGKKQSQINEETYSALGDRYTKSETYNKTELNNLITTPNVTYVNLEATSQTTAISDVLPATGAANAIYKIGNWDGSQFDASVYSEYAWDGSQYVHLSTKTHIGEVFDISAYHATGGTLATYTDLTAALDSNNGGGVPQSLQKGGMSVKFVQSSDNKYIQARCMAQNFTTDVTQWQGVDDEPTVGSENLVKSGGVVSWAEGNYGKVAKNPKWIYVLTDADNKIILGVKKDGSVDWAVGVPKPIQDLLLYTIDDLHLSSVSDIITFLGDIESVTLSELLAGKVNTVQGKTLIPEQYIEESKQVEYIKTLVDVHNRLLEYIKSDGTHGVCGDEEILGKLTLKGFEIKGVHGPYMLKADIDKNGKILYYVDKNGVAHFPAGIESPTIDALVKPGLPTYYTDAWLSNMIDGINDQFDVEKGLSFVFFTDVHFGNYQAGNSKYLIQMILDNTSVPFAICGGDLVWAYGTEDDLNNAISDYREYQKIIGKDRLYTIRGNHDLGITDSSQTPNINYVKSLGFVNSLLSINNGWKHKTLPEHLCAVLENESEKVRILLLNSQDKHDDDYFWGNRNYISAAQLEWIVNDIMADEGYNYVVISHTPADSTLSYYSSTQDNLHNLLLAVKNKTTFSCTVDGDTISKDFSSTTNNILCHITGHNHSDEYHVDNNLLSITTTCDVCSETGRVLGTITEQAFDVFTFDLKNMKLYAYRVGGGNNREWNL